MRPLSEYAGAGACPCEATKLVVGGEADPPAQTAFLGGNERAVGYWGGHEIDRRAVLDELHGAGEEDYYAGRSYIGGLDAAASILGSSRYVGGGGAGWSAYISEAREHLDEAIRKLEVAASQPEWWEVNEGVSMPSLHDLEEIATDSWRADAHPLERVKSLLTVAKQIADEPLLKGSSAPGPEDHAQAEASLKAAQALRVPLQHSEYAATADRKAVRELEEKARSYVSAAEVAAARVSEYTEKVAAALENALVLS